MTEIVELDQKTSVRQYLGGISFLKGPLVLLKF